MYFPRPDKVYHPVVEIRINSLQGEPSAVFFRLQRSPEELHVLISISYLSRVQCDSKSYRIAMIKVRVEHVSELCAEPNFCAFNKLSNNAPNVQRMELANFTDGYLTA